MNRLQSQVHRLYLPQAPGSHGTGPDTGPSSLIDPAGHVRAMVLALARHADWAAVSAVWQGIQADLDLPAPAIAVNGKDAYQLWFSLSEPVPAAQAMAFLDALRLRYLGHIAPQRVGMLPTLDAASPRHAVHAALVPAAQEGGGRWSAFVAPDLAPMFADEPWLDIPPNPDGQASLLARLASIPMADFQRALDRLVPATAAAHPQPVPVPAALDGSGLAPTGAPVTLAGTWQDPTRFLLDVMNNDAVALGLRIDAAKALLPYLDAVRRP
jgi:hypothetical protein